MKMKIKEKINKEARKERKPQDESNLNGSDNFEKITCESRDNLVVRKQLTHFFKVFIDGLEPKHIHVV